MSGLTEAVAAVLAAHLPYPTVRQGQFVWTCTGCDWTTSRPQGCADSTPHRLHVVAAVESVVAAGRAEDRARLAAVKAVLSEWGADSDEDFQEAIQDSGAWRLARDLRAALAPTAAHDTTP